MQGHGNNSKKQQQQSRGKSGVGWEVTVLKKFNASFSV